MTHVSLVKSGHIPLKEDGPWSLMFEQQQAEKQKKKIPKISVVRSFAVTIHVLLCIWCRYSVCLHLLYMPQEKMQPFQQQNTEYSNLSPTYPSVSLLSASLGLAYCRSTCDLVLFGCRTEIAMPPRAPYALQSLQLVNWNKEFPKTQEKKVHKIAVILLRTQYRKLDLVSVSKHSQCKTTAWIDKLISKILRNHRCS